MGFGKFKCLSVVVVFLGDGAGSALYGEDATGGYGVIGNVAYGTVWTLVSVVAVSVVVLILWEVIYFLRDNFAVGNGGSGRSVDGNGFVDGITAFYGQVDRQITTVRSFHVGATAQYADQP